VSVATTIGFVNVSLLGVGVGVGVGVLVGVGVGVLVGVGVIVGDGVNDGVRQGQGAVVVVVVYGPLTQQGNSET
jgi:hypothetical protein